MTQSTDPLRADSFGALADATPTVCMRVGRLETFSALGRDGWRVRIGNDERGGPAYLVADDGGPLDKQIAELALDSIEERTTRNLLANREACK